MTPGPSIGVLNWLASVGERTPGSRPVPVQDGSTWKDTPVAALLLEPAAMVFLPAGATDGERVRYQDIASAHVLEDVNQRYTIELAFVDEQTPRATLVLNDNLFFMIVFAALTSADRPCQFGFTEKRLQALGAKKK